MFNRYFGFKAYADFDFAMWAGDEAGLFDQDMLDFIFGDGQ